MTTQPGVFDRSPLSITVYDAQPSITGQEVWNQHLPQFMSSVGPDDFLILMETPPEIAFQRQRKETAAALESTEAAIAENVRYIELRERLAAPNLGNIGLHTIIVNTETKDPQGSCQSVIEQLHSFRPDLFVEIYFNKLKNETRLAELQKSRSKIARYWLNQPM